MTSRSKSAKKKNQQKESLVQKKNRSKSTESDMEETESVDTSITNECEQLEILVRFPKLKCYKEALLQLIDSEHPVTITSPLSFTAQYPTRAVTVNSAEKLKDIKIGAEPIKAKLKNEGEEIPTKRGILVSRKAHFNEAVDILKKTYTAKDVQCTMKGMDTHLYTMEFESADLALAADNRVAVIYHGIELKVEPSLGPKKRPLEVSPAKEKEAKKAKTDDANGDSEAAEDKEKEEEEEDDDDDDDDEEMEDATASATAVLMAAEENSDDDDEEEEE